MEDRVAGDRADEAVLRVVVVVDEVKVMRIPTGGSSSGSCDR